MTIEMRTLNVRKLDECTALYIDVFNRDPWNDGWTYEDARERLGDIFRHPKFNGIGMYDGDQLIGFLAGHKEKWLSGQHFYMNEMCVKKESQGKGAGTLLISELERLCQQSDITRIYLLTARDGQAEAFYRKNGYYISPKMMMMAKRLNG
ncbi:GNAT family N-acetyltransferase [Halobacillus fulvus]|nr:GNAT family N-acetyltransferase [Halobacillus fulvus]